MTASSVRRPKKYKCPEEGCTKAYSRPCLLEQHQRSHSDVRPFSCQFCGKGFFRDSHLQSHAWTHAKQRPLACDTCPKRFITNQQLQRHLKTHLAKKTEVTLMNRTSLTPELDLDLLGIGELSETTVEEPTTTSIDELWKVQLDKMTREIDSLVQDSPMDQVPSLDLSSLEIPTLSPDYIYDSTATPEVLVANKGVELLLETIPMLDYSVLCEQLTSTFAPSLAALSSPLLEDNMCWDKTDSTDDYHQFDNFISEFIHDPHGHYEEQPELRNSGGGAPHGGEQGVPEMRYQRTFGSEGHRVTSKAAVMTMEESLDVLGEIRRQALKNNVVKPFM